MGVSWQDFCAHSMIEINFAFGAGRRDTGFFSEELVWLAATMQMEPIAYCGIVDAPLAFVIRRIRDSSAIAAIHCSGIFDLMLPSDRISVG
jgi:hypothetical protein